MNVYQVRRLLSDRGGDENSGKINSTLVMPAPHGSLDKMEASKNAAARRDSLARKYYTRVDQWLEKKEKTGPGPEDAIVRNITPFDFEYRHTDSSKQLGPAFRAMSRTSNGVLSSFEHVPSPYQARTTSIVRTRDRSKEIDGVHEFTACAKETNERERVRREIKRSGELDPAGRDVALHEFRFRSESSAGWLDGDMRRYVKSNESITRSLTGDKIPLVSTNPGLYLSRDDTADLLVRHRDKSREMEALDKERGIVSLRARTLQKQRPQSSPVKHEQSFYRTASAMGTQRAKSVLAQRPVITTWL